MPQQSKPDPLLGALLTIITPFVALAHVSFWIGLIIVFLTSLAVLFFIIYSYFKYRFLRKNEASNSSRIIGFFHPYCDAGGGGERVLWCGIRAIQKKYPAEKIIIFTGDVDSAPDQILNRARQRFDIQIPANDGKLEFIYLHSRKWIEAAMWPRFTLLGQSLGSIYLGLEALDKCRPDVFIDTMGYAFTLPVFKYLGQCKVGCYVHYPTISTDMLDKVRTRAKSYNNRGRIANSLLATKMKLIYYKMFAWMYGKAGQCSDLTMVNSSWTEDHINR